jgi:Protein of unknown function (DUF1580)
MIDLSTETLLSFAQAAKRLPGHRDGKPIDPSTVWRWCRRGCKAPDGTVVKLEAVRVGGRSVTSAEALQRFSDALAGEPAEAADRRRRSPTRREQATARAQRKLQELRI